MPGGVPFTRLLRDEAEAGRWRSRWAECPGGFDELVASWNLGVPDEQVVDVRAQVRLAWRLSSWYALGRWSFAGPRSSCGRQEDGDGCVEVDVLRLVMPAQAFRLELRGPAPESRSAVRLLGACTSRSPSRPSPPPAGAPVDLLVPAYSQQVHRGTHPELGGGGASWCSPACTAMVLAFWGAGPAYEELAGLSCDPVAAQPVVVHAAKHTYDAAYRGCGNWSFNVAYAGRYGLEAYVARLDSLAEAQAYLAAGTPLVLSVACGPGELDGAPYAEGTDGHLLVLRGVTGGGDPIVNDPAAAPEAVRRVYPRTQLERAWLRGSGGIAYVIRPAGRASGAAGSSRPG